MAEHRAVRARDAAPRDVSGPEDRFLRSYRLTNWALSLLILYAAALTLLGPLLKATVPWVMPVCAFRLLTGHPCPICGLTTGLRALMRGDLAEALRCNLLTVPAALVAGAELCGRATLLALRLPARRMRVVARLDAGVHKLLLGAYVLYSIAFFVQQALLSC